MSEFEGASVGSRLFGVMVGIVTDNQDPEGLGRVRVRFPWLSQDDASHWARIAVGMAGKDRGMFFLPEVDDEVLVAFEHGRPEYAYVLGALWNGKDKPPTANSDGKNNLRMLRSRSGHEIVLDDTDGAEKVIVRDGGGNNSVIIDVAQGSITITADKKLVIACDGDISLGGDNAKIALKGSELTVECQTVNINNGALEVS